MSERSGRVMLGRIASAHGLRGEVVVHAFTSAPEDIAAYGPLSDEAGARAFELKIVRVTDKGVVARIRGIGDRTSAEALKGTALWVARERLPDTDEDEFYHADLIGLEAVAPDGSRLGEVVGVQDYGAGDLLEIRLSGKRQTEFVPFTAAFVPQIDVEGRRAVVLLAAPEAGDGQGPETDGQA